MARIRLRDDAQVLGWDDLSESQKKTLVDILGTLGGACDNADDPPTTQRARILLVAGARGTGKTSTVLTAQSLCDEQKKHPDWPGDRSREPRSEGAEPLRARCEELLKECGRDLVWLPALNMDPLPPSTNLVGAILARVSHGVTAGRARGGHGGRLDGGIAEDQLLNRFANLQTEAIRAFEGNLEDRKPQMDPEVFAVEASSIEDIKVRFRAKLHEQLGGLAKLLPTDRGRTVFVLPIDDFDTSPLRAVELMKFLHSISMPRLFTIFMGSIDIADKMLYYDIQHQFKKLLGSMESADPEARKDIASAANEIASTSLRKILPPTQRLELMPMEIPEALHYDPGQLRRRAERSSRSRTEEQAPPRPLEALLREIRFPMRGLPKPEPGEETQPHQLLGWPVRSLRDLLLITDWQLLHPPADGTNPAGDPVVHSPSRKDTLLYEGGEMLRAPTRQLSDLWHMLDSVAGEGAARNSTGAEQPAREMSEEDRSRLVGAVVDTLRNLIDEDPLLDVRAQRILKSAMLRNDLDGEWELHPARLDSISHFGDELQLTVTSAESSSWKAASFNVSARRIRDVRIRVLPPPESKGAEPVELSPRTRAVWMLLHDLLLLTERGVVAGTLRHSTITERAYGEWSDGVSSSLRVPWFLAKAQWTTFWQGDIANHVWNRGEVLARKIIRERASLDESDVALVLAYSWIAAGIAALSPEPQPRVLAFVEPRKGPGAEGWDWQSIGMGDWSCLYQAVVKIVAHAEERHQRNQDDRYTTQMYDWLVGLACLLAPETAIPWHKAPPKGMPEDQSWRVLRTLFREPEPPQKDAKATSQDILYRAWGRIQRDVRRARLDRIGKHVATRLGIALLKPASVRAEAPTSDPWAGLKTEISCKEYEALFAPDDEELRRRVERAREQHLNARRAEKGGPLSEEQRRALLHGPELKRAAEWLGLPPAPEEPSP